MKFSVLINNYNYGRYLIECVESVLGQTFPAHEIIVVDDGSSDDSVALARKHFATRPEVKIIAQANQGQVMAIGAGIEAATGDIVCLLDADDSYLPGYLAALHEEYAKRPDIDLIFCRAETTSDPAAIVNRIWLQPNRDYDYGYTALISYFGHVKWLGNNTSTLSLRARLARTLGLKQAAGQFYGAGAGDHVLLYAASVLGARKFYLHRTLVRYRVHEANQSIHSRSGQAQKHAGSMLRKRWIHHHRERSALSDEMYDLLEAELKTVPDPLPEHVNVYRAASRIEVRRRELHRELGRRIFLLRWLKNWWERRRGGISPDE